MCTVRSTPEKPSEKPLKSPLGGDLRCEFRSISDDDAAAASNRRAVVADSSALPLRPGIEVFLPDGAQHPKPVGDGVQVADAMDPGFLVAADFCDLQLVGRHPNVDQRLNLKPVAPPGVRPVNRRQSHGVEAMPPECVVAVAQVGVLGCEQDIHEYVEAFVAQLAKRRDVGAAATLDEPRSLCEVRAGDERADEVRDLSGVGAAVGVQQDNDVTGCRFDAAGQGVAFAYPGLVDMQSVWPKLTSYPGCLIDRIAVDDDDFIDIVCGIRPATCGRLRSSFGAGITTETVGRFASWGSPSQIMTNFAISRPSSR